MSAVLYEKVFEFPVKQFLEHLNKVDNDRILLSAKFGMGKTSFLKYLFSRPDLLSIFDVYHIFPVNYSIASNEDIVRYIKYDIVYQMLEKNIAINEITTSYLESLPGYLKNNLDKVAAAFIKMIPKIGKDVVDAYENLNGLVKEFLSHHDQRNPVKGDLLADYLDQIEGMDGGLFENDIITRIITGVFEENKERPAVLIVDDLDRLDPEHVFKIMNVFAAHFDTPAARLKGYRNKFGFDKIILVCDFLNVESAFYNKYGKEMDFYGYADKFYSSDVYHFDNKLAITSIIRNCLQAGIRNDVINDKEFAFYNKLLMGDDFLESLLQFFTNFSMINLRNLVKLHTFKFSKNQGLTIGRKRHELENLPVVLQLKMLRDVAGDVRRLLSIIERCKNLRSPVHYIDQAFAAFLLIIKLHHDNDVADQLLEFNGKTLFVQYEIWESPIVAEVFETVKGAPGKLVKGKAYKASAEDFWVAMYRAVEVLKEVGYL